MSEKRENRLERLYQHQGTFLFVLAVSMGNRNGYMRIPESHPWHKLLMEMDPKPPTDYDDLTDAVNKEMADREYDGPRLPKWPKEMQDAMNEYDRRRSVTWYEWMDGHIGIHGGWTYADLLTDKDLQRWVGKDHDGIPPGLWFGFDTAHYMDARDLELLKELNPEFLEVELDMRKRFPKATEGHVWTTEEVVTELNRAAEELAAARILETMDV